MAKHFLDSISFSMANTHWVTCLWPWTFHSYEWSFYGP